MGRSPLCQKEGLNKGAWTATEDKILTEYVKIHGEGKWGCLPKKAGLKRCGKSCRLRWLNYLRPDIKRGNITLDEEELIIRLHKLLGNRWSLIAGRLPGRTDNEIKNYWNTKIGKKFQNQQNHDQFPSSRKSSSLDQLCQEKNVSPATQHHLPQPSPVINTNASVVCAKASSCGDKVAIPNDPMITSDHNHQQQIINEPQPLTNVQKEETTLPNPITRVASDEDNFSHLTGDFEIDDKLLSDLLCTSNFSELINFDTGGPASDMNVCDKDPNLSLNSNQALVVPNDASNDSYFPLLGCLMDPSDFDWLQG